MKAVATRAAANGNTQVARDGRGWIFHARLSFNPPLTQAFNETYKLFLMGSETLGGDEEIRPDL
jgi:hypothetical protein